MPFEPFWGEASSLRYGDVFVEIYAKITFCELKVDSVVALRVAFAMALLSFAWLAIKVVHDGIASNVKWSSVLVSVA
jgi:hypothetical protein